MAESTTTPTTEETQQTAPMEQSGGGESKMFTQSDVDRIVKERLARAKATPPADYEDLKAKAAKYDELAESQKSDLERANDAASKAKAEATEWKAKFEAMQAESERQQSVNEMAAKYGVDLGTLSRMGGDVEDNAKYLAGIEAAKPKYPNVRDQGDTPIAGASLEEQLKAAKSERERIHIRAQWKADHRTK